MPCFCYYILCHMFFFFNVCFPTRLRVPWEKSLIFISVFLTFSTKTVVYEVFSNASGIEIYTDFPPAFLAGPVMKFICFWHMEGTYFLRTSLYAGNLPWLMEYGGEQRWRRRGGVDVAVPAEPWLETEFWESELCSGWSGTRWWDITEIGSGPPSLLLLAAQLHYDLEHGGSRNK